MSLGEWIPGPDFRRGFLRIPLQVWLEVYCRAPLTRRQLQLVSVVIRESWGWANRRGYVQLWTRPLHTRHFVELTGLSSDHIRRDLNLLVRRQVLLQDGSRYRFVSDPRLWKRVDPTPLKEWVVPPEQRRPAAENAGAPSALKKEQRAERNVPHRLWDDFSPDVDKSRSSQSFADLSPLASAQTDPEESGSNWDALPSRVVDVVTAFVGSLPPDLAETLRRWICDEGIAAVWRQIEPLLRDPLTARAAVERLLRRRSGHGDHSQPAGGV